MKNFLTTLTKCTLILATIVGLIGCADTESENVTSNGIQAKISVVTEGTTGDTKVWATLAVGSGSIFQTEIKLSGGDSLKAHANSGSKPMQQTSSWFFNNYKYLATFPYNTGDTEFRVEFDRSLSVSAPNSTVTLPAPFSISNTSGDSYPPDGSIQVTWLPSSISISESMTMRIQISCTSYSGQSYSGSYQQAVIDSGLHTVSVAEVLRRTAPDSSYYPKSCSVGITLARERSGILDPNFGEGGSISAKQVRGFTVNITP